MWVGFVPAVIAQYRVMPRRLTSLAPAVAVGGWLGGYLVPVFGGTGTYMTALPLIIGAIVLLIDAGKRSFHERTGFKWFVVEGAVGWVGVELIRSLIPIMGTWVFVANTLYEQPWLIQPVSVFSIFGLGLVIMLVNFAGGLWALVAFDRRWRLDPGVRPLGRRHARRWAAIVTVVLAAWTGMSLIQYGLGTRAANRLLAAAAPRVVRVAAVHHDGGRPPRGEDVADYASQTREAAGEGARVVAWPEVGIKGDPREERTDEFKALASETGAYLVLGYFVPVNERVWRNEATVLTPGGEFLGVFGKDHPVTFGGETSPTRGTYPVYDTEVGKLGTIICYDLDFTDTARKLARKGAQLIAVPSYD